ncbi:hypothetical protein QBC40DRAFT_291545 [Triangularia verruculosa]|uniref:C3H1-type domain-containing protein n=1 Tax=Triangularia verruculosa TaxID=2587418 RepID=A0AAN6X4Q1_9PEZI|nr:hypothetical protein QBC40DRAFT_291545 [Triangularia verruculosa]
MEPGQNLLTFAQRYQDLATFHDSQVNLIKDLIFHVKSLESTNSELIQRIHDRNLDYEDATRSRRELQQRIHALETHLETAIIANDQIKNTNSYVVVLIDGDGLIFKPELIQQGIAGGKKAAYALRSAILGQCGPHGNEIGVLAQVYLNLAGLSKAMRRDGCLENEGNLKDFTLGFTQAKATFDFVDVGHGKERADNKIKEMTKWHLRNHNCKQVILGISHDAGYAPFLDELFQEDSVQHQITILEGVPAVRELRAIGANILNLNSILFRSEKLIDRVPESASSESFGTPFTPAPVTPIVEYSKPATPSVEMKPVVPVVPAIPAPSVPVTTALAAPTPPVKVKAASTVSDSVTSISSIGSPGPLTPASTSAASMSTASTPTAAPATAASTATSYARAIKSVTPPPPPPVIKLPAHTKAALQQQPSSRGSHKTPNKPKPAPWNPGPRGLDPPLQVSQTALDNLKKRKDSNKLCNNHYLRGPCSKGDSCNFEHNYKPSREELVAIAFLTRLNPCSGGQECDVDDCIYGHHCPSVINGACTHPYCKFDKEDHPPGTKIKAHHKGSHDR